MSLARDVRAIFDDSIAVKRRTGDALAEAIARAGQLLAQCLSRGGKILVCGNGGSAGDAQHLSSELLNRFEQARGGFAAVALTTDASTLTSIANDYDYSEVFARQVLALGRPGDALVAISTSGRSANVAKAVAAARERGMSVVALSGKDGGDLPALLDEDDVELRVPAESTARIQETHIVIIHCLCALIDGQLLRGES